MRPSRPSSLWDVLRCPQCGGRLARNGSNAVCDDCAQAFPVAGEQPDLRLKAPRLRELAIRLEPIEAIAGRRRHPGPIPRHPDGLDVDLADYEDNLTNGNGLTPELISWFPRGGEGRMLLDLGCGDRRCEPVLRLTGHAYVGMDVYGDAPEVLGLGEALPFADASFDFVFSLAVLPHSSHPIVAMREISRVLKPGGRLVGTAQFLEPCHMQSRHHVSALGVQDWLDVAGLDLLQLEANEDWLGTDAMLALGLSPRLGWRANQRIGGIVRRLYKAQVRKAWTASPQALPGEGAPDRLTGGFRFVADKPLS